MDILSAGNHLMISLLASVRLNGLEAFKERHLRLTDQSQRVIAREVMKRSEETMTGFLDCNGFHALVHGGLWMEPLRHVTTAG